MMEDVYANVDVVTLKTRPSANYPGPRSSDTSRRGPVVLSLLLLSVVLLAGLIGLGVLYHDAAAELATIQANLDGLTKERDQLKTNNTGLTEERDQLKTNNTGLTEERDQLKTNNTEMEKLLKQKKTCPAGWTMFRCSCYFLSSQTGSWTRARDDCAARGAHLVVISTKETQTFLSGFTKQAAWIGLSDTDKEGTWTWVDGTPLPSTTPQFWAHNQPDNKGPGVDEDCGHVKAQTTEWNDLPCDTALLWICEKVA